MSKICGYSCKHNKSGVCQITVCDRIEVQTFTKYIDPTITKLQQENKQQQKRIEYLERSNNRREDMVIELQNELCEINDYKEKWNDLKDFVNKMHEYFLHTDVNKIYKENMNANNSFPSMFNLSELNASDRILSSICKKMQELERGVSDVED